MPTGPQLVTGPAAVVVGILTGLLAIAAGGFGAWWSTEQRALASEAASFPLVTAEVLSIDVQRHDGDGSDPVRYSPVVRYAFDAGGTRVESERYSVWAPRFDSPEDVMAYLDSRGIRVGQSVQASVDPDDPARSVLDSTTNRRVITGMWALTATGLISVGVGAALIWGLALSPRFRSLVMGR